MSINHNIKPITNNSGSSTGQGMGTAIYDYDDNGNLVKDSSKGITHISYNHLDLPELITRSGGNITYVYEATGVKICRIENGSTYAYGDDVEFSDGVITQYGMPEGRITNNNGVFRT